MTSQPDKLFRDKLKNFQKPASTTAWTKIEAGLDKSSNNSMWMKIAASIVLLAIATILLWPSNDSSNSKQLTHTTSPLSESRVEEKVEKSILPKSELTFPPSVKENPEKKNKNHSIEKISEQKKVEPVMVAQESAIQIPEVETQNPESTSIPEVIVAQTEAVEETTSKTIVYTASEVNAKFIKKQLPVEATSDEKKSSGIQKLMGLAYNLKNSESGLGDLRQKKDEILALNFLDKKQVQN